MTTGAKNIDFGADVQKRLMAGVDKLSEAVGKTIGAKGRNVIIEKGTGTFESTNDGVTVARSIYLEDPIENMGAYAVKEAASQTEEEAGDGTTTCTILTQAIFKNGLKYITAGANPMDLKRGIEKAVSKLVDHIAEDAKEIKTDSKEIEQVATVSANNDPFLGGIIARAFEEVGETGVITTDESFDEETSLEISFGMEFNRGYINPYFLSHNDIETMVATIENPLILLTDSSIHNVQDLTPLLENIIKEAQGQPLLIVSGELGDPVVKILLANNQVGSIRTMCVKAPEVGDTRISVLEDIAALTGGSVISRDGVVPLKEVTIDMLGQCDKAVISRDSTILFGGHGNEEDVEKRVKSITTLLKTEKDVYSRGKLESRLARLSGGVAVLKIGAQTDIEIQDKKRRVDDAISATKSAIAEGIVPGGGVELVHLANRFEKGFGSNEDENLGIDIVVNALYEPFKKIIENAGLSADVVLNEVSKKKFPFGFNVQTEKYEDMMKSGIIDPARVTKSALKNAASVASMLLITDVTITDKKPTEFSI